MKLSILIVVLSGFYGLNSHALDLNEITKGQTIRFLSKTTVLDLDSARRYPRVPQATQYIDEDAFIQGFLNRKKYDDLEVGTVAIVLKDARCVIVQAPAPNYVACAAIIQVGNRHFSLFNSSSGWESLDSLVTKARVFDKVELVQTKETVSSLK